MVTLTLLDQRRKPERFEVGIGKPHRKSLGPGEIPRAATGCQRYYSPAAETPPVPSARLGDGVGFSTAATKQPEVATGPNG